jgi:arylsulfatase
MREGTFIEGDAVRPWNTLSADEKRLFSRMAEVYAGFS